MKLYVPKVLEYKGECGSVCENEYYEGIVIELLGDIGYEYGIRAVCVGELFVIICLI